MSTAIEVCGLTMGYADREVLEGVDFEVRSGEVFCLLGPNGAGKTTTVEILEGFRRRACGTVSVLGIDPQAQPARLRERIGIVLQECGFPRQARVAELIDSWRAYYRHPRGLEDLLKVVELTQGQERPGQAPVGRTAPPPGPGPRPGGRPGPDFPRRADDRLRPRVAAPLLGGDREPAGARQDDPAHHALPRRGGAPRRPGGHPARRPHPGRRHGAACRPPGRSRDEDQIRRPRTGCAMAQCRPAASLEVVVTGGVAVCRDGQLRDGAARAARLGQPRTTSATSTTCPWKPRRWRTPTSSLVSRRRSASPEPRSGASLSRTVGLVRQALLEQRSFWRSAEYALFTFALPLALLLLIGSTTATGYLPGTHVEGQMIFVPSIIAFGVIVAAYVNLGAKLATLRHDGVLKRIRTTPLPASAYLSGVLGSTAATTLAITACIVAIGAFAFGAVPRAERPAGDRRRPRPRRRLLRRPGPRAQRGRAAAPSRRHRSPTPATCRWRSCRGIFDPTFPVPHWLSAAVGLFPVRALAQILQQGYTPVGARPADRPVRPARLDRRRLRLHRLALQVALNLPAPPRGAGYRQRPAQEWGTARWAARKRRIAWVSGLASASLRAMAASMSFRSPALV